MVSTEIVGLVPREALVGYSVEALKLEKFDAEAQVLEDRLEAISAAGGWREAGEAVAAALASTEPTPGGGSAACIAGAMGCALGQMALGISLESKKLEAEKRPLLEGARTELGALRAELERLAGEDAAAFEGVMTALRLPKDDLSRPAKVQAALAAAAEIPLQAAERAAKALAVARRAKGLAVGTVASDMACAEHLLRAAALCAAENVRVNTGSLKDKGAAEKLDRRLEGFLAGT